MNPIEEYLEKEKKKNKIETYLESQGYKQTYQPKMTTSSRQYKSKNDFMKSTSSKAFFSNKQDENKTKIENIFNQQNKKDTTNTVEQNANQDIFSQDKPKIQQLLESGNYTPVSTQKINEESKKKILPTAYNSLKDSAKFIVTETIPHAIKGTTADTIDSVAIDTAANIEKGAKAENKANQIVKNATNMLMNIVNPMSFATNQMKNTGELLANLVKGKGGKDSLKEYTNSSLASLNPVDSMTKEGTELLGATMNEEQAKEVGNDLLSLTDWYREDNAEYQKKLAEQNGVTQLFGNVAETTTRMLPSMAVAAITKNPDVALLPMYQTAKGGYAREALNNGASLEDAQLVGRAKGLTEVGTEKMTGGLKFAGKGNLDDLVESGIKNKVKNEVAQKLLSYGYGIGGEIAEEEVSDIASTLVDRAVYDPDATMPSLKEMGETAKVTALSTMLLNAIGVPVNRVMNRNIQKTNQNTQETQSNPIVPINQERQNTQENVSNNSQINAYTEGNNFWNDNIIPPRNPSSENAGLETDLVNSAKSYNLDANSETIRSINNKLKDRGIASRFDESFFKNQDGSINNNVNAIWRTSTDGNGNIKRDVIFNPQADTEATMQQVAIHEMVHDFEGSKEFSDLTNLILSKNATREGYSDARKQLEDTYSQVYDRNSEKFKRLVDEEEVADTLAQRLGDQDFINSLNQEKPTVFKRIYNWIVEKLNKFTGSSSEKLYWTEIKNKFEDAYKQTYQGNNNKTKYSFVGKKGLNNAIKQEPSTFIITERGLSRAKQMQKAGISNENIRQSTGWFQDRNGNWKFEVSDKGMSIKENIKKNSSNKLGNILNHYTLFTMYPELRDTKVVFKEVRGISGNYNKNSNTITLSNNLIGNNAKLEKTIIHELQHIVQNTEGFETGITSKLSKKAYYENLGEIEAEDVSKRFIDEKYNNKNLQNIVPESSKANPKHRNYDQYMKNRGTIDKIKDSVFKYPKKDGNSNEINQESLEQTNKETLRDNDQQIWNGLKETKVGSIEKIKHSTKSEGAWQKFLDAQIGKTGRGKRVSELRNNSTNTENMNTPIAPINKKTMNPTEISNLKPENASTTPKLPNKSYERGNKQSSFYGNLVTDSKFLSEDFRKTMSQDENIKYYKEITNKDTLEKAYKQLQDGGEKDVISWFSKEGKNADATDVSKGWILLKEYQDKGDFENAVRVAKKMRDIGTTAGQTIQAFNIMSRLTPEGMTMYAQSELTEAYNKMVKGKTQKWIDKNASKFDLSPSETAFIKDTMEQVATMEDGYDKKVKLAEIQKVITDKIPPTAGQSIKSWMRISMLFNPKTQIRNVAGNAVVLPLNTFSDMFASAADKAIARKTGVRTTGNINLKSYAKGFGKGIYESYNDFRKGINTRNIQGNRFEVSEGKNFKDKGIGKALNRVDNMLSFMLDAGDRGFYEASFNNSINNQMVLNNSTEITQEMIDIATNEALQRTWQDNNAYTQTVLSIRNALNGKVSFKGREISNGMEYGAGDVLIPFAKTPANLTKAIVDYSPLGLIKTLAYDARKLVNSINTNQYTPQIQHTFVQNLGKSFSGSFLYVLAYGLAKAGIITGEADDDKDVKNFMKNSLGISSYSIKIGNKTFTYDWAQPIAAPFAIMSNWVKKQKDNPDASIIEKAINAIGTGFDVMLEQSFMESINSVLNGSGSTIENIQNAVLELPARAVPTFSKQIADMVDGTQRTTFEYDRPVKSAINSVIAKIPFASKNLPASRDTLGNEIKKYGGENNVFNVFINPANTNKGELSKAGEEIYKVYQETGETDIFPITAPYYVNSNGDKVTMDSEQRAEYQKVAGTYVEDTLDALLSNSTYKNLTTSQKADLIADIVSDSNARAKHKVLNIESEDAKKKRTFIDKIQPQNYYDYQVKTKDLETNKEKIKVLADSNYSNSVKSTIYEETTGKSDELYQILKKDKININEYLKYKEQEFESDRKDDGTTSGKAISGSKKKKVYNYVNNMNITYKQRLLLLGTQYKLTTNERKELAYYVNSLPNTTKKDKLKIYEKLKGFTVYKNGTVSW